MTQQRRHLGIKGENIAVRYLIKKGFQILDRNFRCRLGEIDIIAMDKGCLVFIEVRTKSSIKYGLPQESVTQAKINKLRRLAQFYLVQKSLYDINIRFDVIAVTIIDNLKVTHIKNAF